MSDDVKFTQISRAVSHRPVQSLRWTAFLASIASDADRNQLVPSIHRCDSERRVMLQRTRHGEMKYFLWADDDEVARRARVTLNDSSIESTGDNSGISSIPWRRVCSKQTPTSSHHHRGRQIRLVYTELTSTFFCCPGWSQVTQLSFGCNKPTCPTPCSNGGICTLPGKCTCPKGYTGNQCQIDVDECAVEKPCGQLCTNLPGGYRCHCRVGFQLQQDGQSCWRNDTDENAFEARDLEGDFHDASTTKDPASHDTENEVNDNDQDYEIILRRLTKLEKQVARNRKRDTEASEMNTKVTLAVERVNEMKRTVDNVQLIQREVYDMRSKMKQYEAEMRKMQHLMNRVSELENRIRIRCRSAISINSGSLNF
ncbi:hypothetical protein HN011_003044 [Eciton burchellii]|nr:hypothetical protein HN011_003044 [Eciton burchellii]